MAWAGRLVANGLGEASLVGLRVADPLTAGSGVCAASNSVVKPADGVGPGVKDGESGELANSITEGIASSASD